MDVLLPRGWAPPIGYANGIAADAGRIVFIAGQVGWDARQKFHSEEIVAAVRAGAAQRPRGARGGRRQAGAHLPHDRILLRQARLPRRAQASSARAGVH